MSATDNFDNNNPFSGIVPEQVKNTEEKKENLNLPKNEVVPSEIKTLGDKLKSLRLNHFLSIEQLADTTRIRSEFLVALEENDFSKLPGLVFAKGFIKNLARFYKIKDEELIALFQSSSSDKSEDSSKNDVFVNKILSKNVENSTEFPPDDITHKNGNILNDSSKEEGVFHKFKKLLFLPKYIFLSLLIIIVVAVIVYFVKYDSYSDEVMNSIQSSESLSNLDSNDNLVEPTDSTTVSGSELTTSDNEVNDIESSNTAVTTTNDTTSTTNTAVDTSNEVTTTTSYLDQSVVKVSVKSAATIRTKKDSSAWEEKSYPQGEYVFEFKNVFHIFIENSSLVNLSINDVDLGDLSNKGVERRLTFYHNKELPLRN